MRTEIRALTDGVVIARNVEAGQFINTQATQQTPLFTVARDLRALRDAKVVQLLQQDRTVRCVQRQAPNGRLVEAGQAIEHRRLTCTWWAVDDEVFFVIGVYCLGHSVSRFCLPRSRHTPKVSLLEISEIF